MAEVLDEVVQKLILEGDNEVLAGLSKVGKEGAEHLNQLSEAIEHGTHGLGSLASLVATAASAVAGLTAVIGEFVHQQAEAVVQSNALAEAMGTNLGKLQQIEAAFAAGGVSVATFERFANRLTLQISQQWPQIAESVKNYATQADQAHERVSSAILRSKQAQQDLAIAGGNFASQAAANNSRVEKAYIALRFAAEQAYSQIRKDQQAVLGAGLSLEAAEQRLATLQGRPPSEAAKKNLEIAEATLAVEKAQSAEADARLAKRKNAAEAAQKQKDLEQAAADAERKRANDDAQAQLTFIKLQEAVKNAATEKAAAQEKADKLALTNVASISNALGGIVDKNKSVASSVDLTKVKIQDLERGIFKLASAGGDKPPTGLEALSTLAKVLANDTDKLIPKTERLALVQKFAGASAITQGAATADLLKVLEKGPANFEKFAATASKTIDAHAIHDIEHFNDAMAELSLTAQIVQQNLAAAAAPAFTAFLNAVRGSLESSTGLLHLFVEGIKAVGAALTLVGSAFVAVTSYIDKAFDLEKGRAMQILIVGLIALVGAFAIPWAAIPAAIALIVIAMGYLYENFDKIKKGAELCWQAIKDSTVGQFIQGVGEKLDWLASKADNAWEKLKRIFKGNGSSDPKNSTGPPANGSEGSTVIPGLRLAAGGQVDGPGTTTSDSIFAKLSRGEFVVRAAAVEQYGAGLFHQLNNMSFPGFAAGGMVPAPVRMGGGSGINPATSTLNLSIDGRSFNGLRGPRSVVDDLSQYAIGRNAASAGDRPSWVS